MTIAETITMTGGERRRGPRRPHRHVPPAPLPVLVCVIEITPPAPQDSVGIVSMVVGFAACFAILTLCGVCLTRGSSAPRELPLTPPTAPVVTPRENQLAQVVEMTDMSDDTPTANAIVLRATSETETDLPVANALRPIVAKPPGHANEDPHIEDL